MNVVYVEGVELPKNCKVCPLSYMYENDFSTNCKLKFGLWNEEYEKRRHKRCPLREVKIGEHAYGPGYKISQQAARERRSKKT